MNGIGAHEVLIETPRPPEAHLVLIPIAER